MACKLYDICLRKISLLLKDRLRDESPFPQVPSRVLHDLIGHILRLYSAGGFRASYLEPLLLSGQVRQLALHGIRLEEELLPTLRSFTVCRGLRALSLVDICDFNSDIVSRLMEELLHALKGLEELHCSVVFSLTALRKCRKLQSVRLHFTPQGALDDFLDDEQGVRGTHEHLSHLTLCGQRADKCVSFKELAQLLIHCPRLRSLGYLDVSAAFGHLRSESEAFGHRGSDTFSVPLESSRWREHKIVHRSHRDFFERTLQPKVHFLSSIRAAASACPLLRELVIKIPQQHYHGAFSVLSSLRNLTYLEIELDYSKRDFRPEVFCLLSEIGSQLRHLALHRIDHVEFDAIFKSCPLLVSLKVDCDRAVGSWSETIPRQLQRLTFFSLDGCCPDSVTSVLVKCSNLQELFLKNAEYLSDGLLHRILRDNPEALACLRTACICDCALTPEGLKKLLASAQALEKISFESSKTSEEDAESLIRKTNPAARILEDYGEGLREEFFYRRRFVCV